MRLPDRAFLATDGGALLLCHVHPGARRGALDGAYGDAAVKISVASPPVDGKANKALCALVAFWCGVPKSAVSVRSGETSREKTLFISGKTAAELKLILESMTP